ncbi:MAG: DNA polymerase III subunit gamma/tau, partial [Candidatus Bipolaricaulota bacterium]
MGPNEKEHELSLYRRWRPLRFADVVGQELAVQTLQRAVSQGQTAHAFLFSGQRGVGKTSVARILARAVNCLAPQDGEPCNACESCIRIQSGTSLDVVEIDGASNRGIDQIRQLREQVGYVPAGAARKVYIIDEVHMLTGEAFNALLKTLEEPPPRVLFVLATTEPHKVPLTVLSRCQAFEFAPLPPDQIAGKLLEIARNEGLEVEPEAAQLIARRSGGALRDAEVLLEQLAHNSPITQHTVQDLLGLPPEETVDTFVSALASREAQGPLSTVAELTARGRDLGMFLEEAAARARDRIIGGETELIAVARALVTWRAELPRVVSRRLHVELGILELCGAPSEPAPSSASEPVSPDPRWTALLADCYRRSRALAVFLLPAKHHLADGSLHIILPADCRFHYDCLQ